MGNPLDELEEEARKRSKGAGRSPGGSRRPRKAPTAEELAEREAERLRREERRQSEEEQARRDAADVPPPPAAQKAGRPKSIPFYPNPEDEEFLWVVAEAAIARREKVPATAVLRLALRRLSDQMTPSEVVRALSGPVQTEGKMGRPRR